MAKYGWQVPAYPLPKDRDDVIISRIVVRPSMTMTIADDFIDDLKLAINNLNKAKLVHSDPETVKMTDTVASH